VIYAYVYRQSKYLQIETVHDQDVLSCPSDLCPGNKSLVHSASLSINNGKSIFQGVFFITCKHAGTYSRSYVSVAHLTEKKTDVAMRQQVSPARSEFVDITCETDSGDIHSHQISISHQPPASQ